MILILIYLNGAHLMSNISKLTQSLSSDSIVDGIQDPRTSHINSVQMNKRIIDHQKNCNILLIK